MVIVRLDGTKDASNEITTYLIEEWVNKLAEFLGVDGRENANVLQQLVRDLEADYNDNVRAWSCLADDGDHVQQREDLRPGTH